MTYELTTQALKDLRKLSPQIQRKIIKKLPLRFAQRLVNREIGDYRYRIGDYRVIFDVEGEKIIVLTLGHRREIYK